MTKISNTNVHVNCGVCYVENFFLTAIAIYIGDYNFVEGDMNGINQNEQNLHWICH